MANNWIEVDRAGLAQVIADRPKSFLLFELIQNALDEQTTKVDVEIGANELRGNADIKVTDDSPDGYQDIRHAWTMFAPSKKKDDPELRGRFNVGCKMVLALARCARIVSTQSAVEFSDDEGRRSLRSRREAGTEFTGTFRMTKVEIAEAIEEARTILPPPGVVVTINGEPVERREPFAQAECTLPTVRADDEGVLRRTARKCRLEMHTPLRDEVPTLYEMGIPVVELDGDDPYHVDVMQRVPLNVDRDNVTPAYLRTLRVEVLNATHDQLTEEQARSTWATEASEDERADDDAVEQVLTHRFGEKRVAYDPSDPEANMLATSKGFTVVHGGALTKGQWSNSKRGESLLPAGQVTPSPSAERRPDGVKPVPPDQWDDSMTDIAEFAKAFARALDVATIERVDWFDAEVGFFGAWEKRSRGRATLLLCRPALRSAIAKFDKGDRKPIVELLVHEFAHQHESNHLDEAYHDELCRLAARCLELDLARLMA